MQHPSLRGATGPLVIAAALSTALPIVAGCESLGIKANIVTTTNVNGKTTVKKREAKNWNEFKEAMGEVATDFSGVAKQVGATTTELVKKLVDAPPPGKVTLTALDPGLKQYDGDIRYDYLTVAAAKPNAEYDFKYVQIGMREYDDFFKASAEMYGCAYQLTETVRHIRVARAEISGTKEDTSAKADDELKKLEAIERTPENSEALDTAKELKGIWQATATLGGKLVGKVGDMASAGAKLVTSAPKQITNPKLVLHIKLIVKGLDQSVGFVKDTGKILTGLVG